MTKKSAPKPKPLRELSEVLAELEARARVCEGTHNALRPLVKGTDFELLLDECLFAIGQEVLLNTLNEVSPEERTAAARLMLKRADQRRVDRLHEEETKNATKPTLTPEEKERRVKQILGIS